MNKTYPYYLGLDKDNMCTEPMYFYYNYFCIAFKTPVVSPVKYLWPHGEHKPFDKVQN